MSPGPGWSPRRCRAMTRPAPGGEPGRRPRCGPSARACGPCTTPRRRPAARSPGRPRAGWLSSAMGTKRPPGSGAVAVARTSAAHRPGPGPARRPAADRPASGLSRGQLRAQHPADRGRLLVRARRPRRSGPRGPVGRPGHRHLERDPQLRSRLGGSAAGRLRRGARCGPHRVLPAARALLRDTAHAPRPVRHKFSRSTGGRLPAVRATMLPSSNLPRGGTVA